MKSGDEIVRDIILDILKNYSSAKRQEDFNKESQMYQKINYDFRDIVNSKLKDKNLVAKGSCGAGQWTRYPWLAVYNKNITTTIQNGVYVVYLFSEDMERIYLTLNQGCTKLKSDLGKKKAVMEMDKMKNIVRNHIDSRGFDKTNSLKVGHDLYEKGTIFYKEYERNSIPLDNILEKDLRNMLDIYNEYYEKIFKEERVEVESMKNISESRKIIESIQGYINSKGYIYSYDDLANFYLSLKTKPFIILAGTSGTGKSKLARLFAEAVGTSAHQGFKLISVKPDWNDSTELLGYKNIEEKFIEGQFTRILVEAQRAENKNKPYIICMDEMNLARVEYYFSEYLSLIESREWRDGQIITDNIFNISQTNSVELSKLCIPDNIYIVGTVNMDDTTFAFSKKVLDRANTIEFSDVNLKQLDFNLEEYQAKNLHNDFLRTSFLNIKEAMIKDQEYVRYINQKVVELNDILKKAKKHFGYRVRDEIVFYMMENKIHELLDEDKAFDFALLQKVLPSINGSGIALKKVLIEIYNYCNPAKKVTDNMDYIEDCEKHLERAKYKKSAEKVISMMKEFEDGYASFWG